MYDIGELYEKLASCVNYHLNWTILITALHEDLPVVLQIP
jgi:hypothetical protein